MPIRKSPFPCTEDRLEMLHAVADEVVTYRLHNGLPIWHVDGRRANGHQAGALLTMFRKGLIELQSLRDQETNVTLSLSMPETYNETATITTEGRRLLWSWENPDQEAQELLGAVRDV